MEARMMKNNKKGKFPGMEEIGRKWKNWEVYCRNKLVKLFKNVSNPWSLASWIGYRPIQIKNKIIHYKGCHILEPIAQGVE